MSAEKPKLRNDLDFMPVQSDGKIVVLIRDRLGINKQDRVVSPELYGIMTMLDGSRSARDIQADLMRRQGGDLIPIEEIENLLLKLDSSFFLDSPHYQEAKRNLVAEFSSRTVRHSSHAGLSYPGEKEDLRGMLDGILAIKQEVPSFPDDEIIALIAPHIDLEAGKKAYSNAYRSIQGITPKKIIVLGVGHVMAKDMFCLTRKSFETPLGKVEVDQEIIAELTKAGNDIVSEDDFAHKNEHSIEFQLIFLQHILGDSSFKLVPVLCGSLIGGLPEYTREAYKDIGDDFLNVLSGCAKDGETLLIAGVDFSHVGPKFGHDRAASLILEQSETHDRRLLDCLCEGNADGFWSESARAGDRYHVCGFSALACLLEILPSSRGHLLSYETFTEDTTRSAVSFASAVFTRY